MFLALARRSRLLLVSLLATTLVGCGAPIATRAPRPSVASDDSGIGLFPADADQLGDGEIARILDYDWKAPAAIRIALLRLEDPSEAGSYHRNLFWYRYDTNSGAQTAFAAVDILRSVPGVFDVSYLPGFLLPQRKSIALIREAAARYQADWILVYRPEFRTNPDRRLFGKDDVSGVCVVEAALLDTRTGLLPFCARVTRPLQATEQDGEDLRDLILRAEQLALDGAMKETAEALAAFVAAARTPAGP